MKKIPININVEGIELNPAEKAKTPQALFFSVVDAIVQSYMATKQGFDEADRRKWYKIEDAFEGAVKANAEHVELDDDWWGWLKTARREARMRPVKLMRKVDEAFDSVAER